MFKNQKCRNLHIGIQNFPNIHAPDSTFPNGSIRDQTLSLPGTPVNKETVGDMYEFFAKLMREAGITANGIPDNEYNGNQLFAALWNLINFTSVRVITGLPLISIIVSNLNQLVNIDPGANTGHILALNPTGDNRQWPCCQVTNNSGFDVDVTDLNGDDVNGSVTYVLPAGANKKFYFDRANDNWIPA